MFRQLPTKSNILPKYVAAEFRKEISLIKDCKTRWNSFLLMLQRVFLLKYCVQKALKDISRPEGEFFSFSNNEISHY